MIELIIKELKDCLNELEKQNKGKTCVPISMLTDITKGKALISKDRKDTILKQTGCKNLSEVLEKYNLAELDKTNTRAIKIVFKTNNQNNLENKLKDNVPIKKNNTAPMKNESTLKIVANSVETYKAEKMDTNRHDLIEKILEKLNSNIVEKEEALRLSLLVAVAGESIFFLGLPGTAKSMVARRLKEAFKTDGDNGIQYFEYLMNQFSTPDELFGPISLKSLENDTYKRITKGFLPEADVVFLDEIWKANPAIQNTLLTIINEKKFHNGNEVVDVPLKVLVAASNELPAQNMGLEALWDRFIVRLIVNPVSENNFFDVVTGSPTVSNSSVDSSFAISANELKDWQKEIDSIDIPDNIKDVITDIRKKLQIKKKESQENFYVSDRRWKKIVHLLRTSAFLNGRHEVDLMDCQLISYCIWDNEKQRKVTDEIVSESIKEYGIEYTNDVEDIKNAITKFDKYITENFYIKKEDKPLVKKIQGNDVYELKEEVTLYQTNRYYGDEPYKREIKYISINDNVCYDKNQERQVCKIGDVTFSNRKISFTNSYIDENRSEKKDQHEEDITMKSIEGFEKDKTVFSEKYNELYAARKKEADKKKEQIEHSFSKAYEKIKNFRNEKESAFDKNLFADPAMKKVIMSKVDDAQIELEKMEQDFTTNIVSRYQK